jgi:hypothetical protein
MRARQRRFTEHRAWMVRSYSLTAAAITTRMFAFPMLLITRDPVLAINLIMISWPLNLLFAEMLVRRGSSSAMAVSAAVAHAEQP